MQVVPFEEESGIACFIALMGKGVWYIARSCVENRSMCLRVWFQGDSADGLDWCWWDDWSEKKDLQVEE